MATLTLPTFSDVVRRAIVLEPLTGPKDVFYYLDRFPEEIYNKSPDSHLYKYLRSLLGEAGANWLKKNHFEARVMLEEFGIDAFDLDRFFGSPFAFGRIVDEQLDEDPYGVIPRADWEIIKAKNAKYRNRALDYINGVRGGNTPLGMRLVARAGLGHDAEIVENYRFLFDQHSDDLLGLDYYGKTLTTEEMVVLPRREIGRSEQQMVSISGTPNLPNAGTFQLFYDTKFTDILNYNASSDEVRVALEAIVGEGNVTVTGGPGPLYPWLITFQGALSNRDVAELDVPFHDLTFDGQPVNINVSTLIGGQEAVDEVVAIAPKDQFTLQAAIDRIRAQTTLMTLGAARGMRSRTQAKTITASSEYTEVLRFVRGNPVVPWPVPDSPYWIEPRIEKQAPRISGDLQYHYTGFHSVIGVEGSSFSDTNITPDMAVADYHEPLFITSATDRGGAVAMVNGVYPQEYKDLPGVPPIRYNDDQFWESVDWDLNGASRGQEEDEWLIFKFQFVRCCNYVSFDIVRDDIEVTIDYDAYDGTDERLWVPVTKVEPYPNRLVRHTDSSTNTWASVGLTFTNRKQELVWTRALRMRFHRTDSSQDHWGYPIKIRNFRAARNVA